MAIAALFSPDALDEATFRAIHAEVTETVGSYPPGRLHNVCFGEPGQLKVFDLWKSVEALQTFGQTLGPMLAAHGVQTPMPGIAPLVAARVYGGVGVAKAAHDAFSAGDRGSRRRCV